MSRSPSTSGSRTGHAASPTKPGPARPGPPRASRRSLSLRLASRVLSGVFRTLIIYYIIITNIKACQMIRPLGNVGVWVLGVVHPGGKCGYQRYTSWGYWLQLSCYYGG
eukprot:290467-Hanusia_phi.AAC.3